MKRTAALGTALCLAFNMLASPAAQAHHNALLDPLRFHNLHTDEDISVPHRHGQAISSTANRFLRDWRRNEPTRMDSRLFDLLIALQDAIHKRHPDMAVRFNVISGYRSPATNASLRAGGGSQAKQSLHMEGMAIDIAVPGISTKELRDIATCLKAGGVGYYEADGFVHVDVGNVRYWPSRAYLKNLSC
ncbi:MAG: DUF882 domain-containing protein [Micavibrio aeruginosavorus]|nr:DUF882 domain-containing protein [Micavibrio aeruginosavorus]